MISEQVPTVIATLWKK